MLAVSIADFWWFFEDNLGIRSNIIAEIRNLIIICHSPLRIDELFLMFRMHDVERRRCL